MDLNIAEEFEGQIDEIIQSQVQENKEAIFFIYDDLTTSDIYQGQSTKITLTREEEAKIMSQGEIIGSVHTHPSGFDPSTIDVMTGLATTQKYMSVATPIYSDKIEKDFVLTTLDLSRLSFTERFRMMKAMRRSSIGLTDLGRTIRKEINLERFDVKGYRSHKVEIDGVEVPIYERPSIVDLKVGNNEEVKEIEGMHEFIE